MKTLDIKTAIISAIIAWILGVTAYAGSWFIPIMEDPEFQANMVLAVALIPAAALGAHTYFRRGHSTNGFLLGSFMFLVTILLDACITVPVFILPSGGDYPGFFGDPGFWLIGLEYISVVSAYWYIRKTTRPSQSPETIS